MYILRPVRGKVGLLFVPQLLRPLKSIRLSTDIGTKELMNIDHLHLKQVIDPATPLEYLISGGSLRPIELL